MQRMIVLALLSGGILTQSVLACSICNGSMASKSTLRQEALQSKHVYVGTMSNPRLNGVNATGAANAGATDFTVDQVLKSDAARKAQKRITIPKYVPVDPKAPNKFVLFCTEANGQVDPVHGTPIQSPAMVEYLRGVLAIDPNATDRILAFAGKHLDSSDPDVAAESFLEFAKANDVDVLKAAKTLVPTGIRKLVNDPNTPVERLGLFVYLLGACGGAEDVQRLKELLQHPSDRFRGSISGLYAGLITLQPVDGWKNLHETLSDGKQPFTSRLAALSALRFFVNVNHNEYRAHAVKGLKALLAQDDIADFAVEDLRKYQFWDCTTDVLGLFAKKGYESPLMQRAILKYALCCPSAEAKLFVTEIRLRKADLVKEIEESLQYEQSLAKP